MNQQAQAQPADRSQALARMLSFLLTVVFKSIPMIAVAFFVSGLFLSLFISQNNAVELMMRFNLTFNMPENPTYVYVRPQTFYLYLITQFVVMFLGVVTMVKGWWTVHLTAGLAITPSERRWYKWKLYGLMTALLTLVLFLLRITIFNQPML